MRITPENGFTSQKLISLCKIILVASLVVGNAMLLLSLHVEAFAQQTNTTNFEITHGIASGEMLQTRVQ